ncbi:hypothetical protein AB6E87_22160, partial [Vibrio sp. 10N.247.311.64]|uniref:hypothetical protein n=1 Tax=Vibrio sp. 10N.247.311.64 TaxID=3229997 RepID=UPI00354ADEC1
HVRFLEGRHLVTSVVYSTKASRIEFLPVALSNSKVPLSKLEMLISLKCPDSVSPTFAYASNRDEALAIRT